MMKRSLTKLLCLAAALCLLLGACSSPAESGSTPFDPETATQAVLDSVAEGTDLVGITLEETALKRAAAGEDIALIYPDDGTSCLPDGCALVQGAPHPENARRFLDFIAGEDVQSRLETEFSRRPVREGVEGGGVLRPLEELALVDYDLARTVEQHDSILMSWAFYLGGGEES